MSLTTNIENIFKKGVIGNVRKAQEDSHDIFLKTPNGDVFVVCDGMGGHVGGAVASSMAVKSIKEYLEKEAYPDPIQALNGALQFANQQILGYSSEHPELKGMGTTACIVMFRGDEAWIAHVGDSRIYLFLGKEKELHRITKDHSFVQTLVDAGQISDEEAEHHPNKNRILKALGILPELKPTFSFEPIHPKNGDVFMICTDGLCGMITDATIRRVLSQEGGLDQKGEQLIQLAMEGEIVRPGGQDNCTVELIRVDNSPWNVSEFKSFNPVSRGMQSQAAMAADQPLAQPSSQHAPMSAKWIAAIVVGGLLLLAGGWYLLHNMKAKVGPGRAGIEQVQQEISEIEAKIQELKEKKRECDSVVAHWEPIYASTPGEAIQRRIEASRSQSRAYRDSIGELESRLDALNASLTELRTRGDENQSHEESATEESDHSKDQSKDNSEDSINI